MRIPSNPATDKVKEGKGKVAAMKVWLKDSNAGTHNRTGIRMTVSENNYLFFFL